MNYHQMYVLACAHVTGFAQWPNHALSRNHIKKHVLALDQQGSHILINMHTMAGYLDL
jgi:hypothetical protein